MKKLLLIIDGVKCDYESGEVEDDSVELKECE